MNGLIVPDVEVRLDVPDPLDVGDTVEVVRGDGPGDRVGDATVTGFDRGGFSDLDVHLEVVMSGRKRPPGTCSSRAGNESPGAYDVCSDAGAVTRRGHMCAR